MDVVFALGEKTGDDLVVGVASVVAMKKCGVDVVALGVDEQRLVLLWEFVLGGQGVHLGFQPQQDAVRGFRLGRK
jgi:hypothetical protein